jgi:hypothetical protein
VNAVAIDEERHTKHTHTHHIDLLKDTSAQLLFFFPSTSALPSPLHSPPPAAAAVVLRLPPYC